eukprot:4704873-Alexandrium_andersonii.AAC.1
MKKEAGASQLTSWIFWRSPWMRKRRGTTQRSGRRTCPETRKGDQSPGLFAVAEVMAFQRHLR